MSRNSRRTRNDTNVKSFLNAADTYAKDQRKLMSMMVALMRSWVGLRDCVLGIYPAPITRLPIVGSTASMTMTDQSITASMVMIGPEPNSPTGHR